MMTRRQRVSLGDEYFDWLSNRILATSKKKNHYALYRELHKKIFRWTVHNDDNRCEDGLRLREQFIDEVGNDRDHLEVRYFLKGECTVFEMLVGLAIRMNDLMEDLKSHKNNTYKWFQELIKNLQLEEFTDDSTRSDSLPEMDRIKIDDILEIWMDRTYAYDGYGGLFPLKRRPLKNQKDVEIWYQLHLWLDENYGY